MAGGGTVMIEAIKQRLLVVKETVALVVREIVMS